MPPAIPRGLQPGDEIDYAQRTTGLTVTATADATADTFITGAAVVYDGATTVMIEVSVPYGAATAALILNLYDGSTDLGRFGQINSVTNAPMRVARRLTPSAASHTYTIKAWKSGGTASLNQGAGGTATDLPAFMRITKV